MINRFLSLILAFGLCFSLTACDNNAGGNPASTETSTDKSAALSDSAKYDKSIRNEGCEILSSELVSSIFGTPADELKQIKAMGCIYTWNTEGQMLEARLSMLTAHRSEKIAARWFANATRDVSAEEVERQVGEIMDRLKDKAAEGEIGDGVTEQNVDTIDTAMTGAVAAEGVRFGDIDGIGDEARINLEDASFWVRVENLTFTVGAYKGEPMPQPDYKTMDLQKIAAESQAANRAWLQETFEQRKRDGQKLAEAIIAEL